MIWQGTFSTIFKLIFLTTKFIHSLSRGKGHLMQFRFTSTEWLYETEWVLRIYRVNTYGKYLSCFMKRKIKKSEAHLFNVRHQRLVQARFHGKPGQHNTHCFSALYYVGWIYLYRILKSEEKNISIHKFYILEGIKA